MEIDIEALIAAKREKREKRIQAQNDSELERRARRMEKQREVAEWEDARLREHAAFIAARLAEYSPGLLEDWFILDHWTVQDALILLAGFCPKHIPLDEEGRVSIPLYFDEDPWADDQAILHKEVAGKRVMLSRIRRLDGLDVYGKFTFQILGVSRIASITANFSVFHNQLLRIWNSGAHTEQRYPPKYFIDWALSKNVQIDWLEWAKVEGYYGDQAAADETPLSTKERNNYLHLIGALLEVYWESTHPGKNYYGKDFNLSEVAKALEDRYKEYGGMSERQLSATIPKARASLKR